MAPLPVDDLRTKHQFEGLLTGPRFSWRPTPYKQGVGKRHRLGLTLIENN